MESVKDELTCSICRELWQEPISLPCQHSLCRKCLAQLMKNTPTREDEHVPCPECRSPFGRMDEYELAEVPTNFKLAEIVRKLQCDASNIEVSCAKHNKTCCVYCVQCQASLCTRCIPSHKGHSMGDLQSEAQSKKASLQDKVDKCKALIPQMEVSIFQLSAVSRKIQENEDARSNEIVRAYGEADRNLMTWWKKSVEEVENRHREWRRECNKGIDELKARLAKLQKSLTTSTELMVKTDVEILQGSDQVKKEMVAQVQAISDDIYAKFNLRKDLLTKLDKDQAGHTKVKTDKEVVEYMNTAMSKLHSQNKNEEARNQSEYNSFEVRMGTYLRQGSHYWEANITVSQSETTLNHSVCKAGLLETGLSWDSPGDTSWYIGAQYRGHQFSAYSVCDYDEVSIDYQAWRKVKWPHVLGFNLDWPKRVLKVLDRGQGKLVCTVSNVNLKKPVVPAVRLELSAKGSVSVDMAEMDYSSLPQEILQLIYAD